MKDHVDEGSEEAELPGRGPSLSTRGFNAIIPLHLQVMLSRFTKSSKEGDGKTMPFCHTGQPHVTLLLLNN